MHDALLIEAPVEVIKQAAADCQTAMPEASSLVLSGFELRSEFKIIRYPERYSDPRGEPFWQVV